MRLCSIVAATDLGQAADRALLVAAGLARRAGLPLEVLTVVADGDPHEVVAREQQKLIERHELERPTLYIEHATDVGSAIADHVTNRQGALLVMATTARGAPGEHRLGAITEAVLGAVRQPVLILGPNAVERVATRGLPVAVVDGSAIGDVLIRPIEAWAQTFSVERAIVLEVIPPTSWPSADDPPVGHVRAHVERLARHGVEATGQVLRAEDAAPALIDYAARPGDPLLVMASPRWEGDPTHWFVTVRRVISRTTGPVLVVPTDLLDD